ncbi:MAG: hypothetical protein WCS31_14265 [Verrucomicrobiae bacterium]
MSVALAILSFVAIGLNNGVQAEETNKDTYYVAVPKYGCSEKTLFAFYTICMKLPRFAVENEAYNAEWNTKVKFIFWRIDPMITILDVKTEQKSLRRGTFLQKYPKLPTDVVAILEVCLGDFKNIGEKEYLQPLFPTHQTTHWLQTDTLNVYIDNSFASPNEREDGLISQLRRDTQDRYKNRSSFAALLKEFCVDMAVPVDDVWYLAEYNILIIRANEDFGGFMEALLAVAN